MYQQFDPARRQPKAVALAATRSKAAPPVENAGVNEMMMLSLVGLATLFVIAHYAGSDLLAQIFAL